MSFNTVLGNLKTTLEGNASLLAFCNTEFGRGPTVKRVYKNRVEIAADELPIIMITRPVVEKTFRVGVRDGKHTVSLYCGFQQNDRENAQDNIIEFEELIDDALLQPEPGSIGALNITPMQSANDEGKYHPYYFIVMDVEILHRRLVT